MNEEVKKVIEKINLNLKELNENIPKLISIIFKEEEKTKIPEGYISFNFIEPLQSGKGFEKFLLGVLEKEEKQHGIKNIIKRNEKNEIIRVLLQGDKEHINHVLNACVWINKKISEKQQKQERKFVPHELM
jgi:hypothetical protein